MAASFLCDHPGLRPFHLENVRLTGTTIGAGAYGSVEEVEIPGAKCAAKKIHEIFQDRRQIPEELIQKASREFVQECQLMSTLRHPHIVQFLGVCFLPGSRLPALVMERLLTSLHEILDPEPPPETKPYIPVGLKRSVLYDVARGLSFLHSHSPPIIHRDLSARNVLLNSGMLAKIADLGVARIVPSLRAATMTKAPGASIYMPPEALEDESRYDVTIDIFSLGVLAIFTLSQTFPKPLSATYMDDSGLIARNELERRGNYMQQIHRLLREGHPLIQMIQRCLKNRIRERPTIHAVLEFLEQARAEIQDGECDMSKLELVQTLRQKTQLIERKEGDVQYMGQQLAGKDEVIQSMVDEIQTLSQQLAGKEQVILIKDEVVRSKEEEMRQLQSSLGQQKLLRRQLAGKDEVIRSKDDEIRTLSQQKDQVVRSKDQVIRSKEGEIQQLQSSLDSRLQQIQSLQAHLKKPVESAKSVQKPSGERTAVTPTPVMQSLCWPLPLQWRRGKDLPIEIRYNNAIILNGIVYVGGGDWTAGVEYIVQQYNPESGKWSKLPRAPVVGFAMTSLNGQLVLAGGNVIGAGGKAGRNDRITVWDSGRGEWAHPYPPMPTRRSMSAAVGYQNYLIVACGFIYRDTVEVLDSSSGRWYSAQPLPVGGHKMSSVVVGDRWYLSSFYWKDYKPRIFCAHLSTLISSATSAAHANAASIWQELPTPPADPTLLALQGHLLLVGGGGYGQELRRYEPEARQWMACGQLPVGLSGPSCAVLPSGELMVAGGEGGFCKRVWLGSINC